MPPTLRSRTSKNSNCIILLDSSFTTEEKGVESINEVEILDTTLHDSPSDNEVSGSDSAVDTLDNHSENSTSSNYLVTRLKNIEANKALLKSLRIGNSSDLLPKKRNLRPSVTQTSQAIRRSSRLVRSDPTYNPSLSDLEEDETYIRKPMRKKQKSNISNNENSRKGYTLTHCPSMQSFKNLPYVLWTQGSTFGEIPGIPIGSLFPYRIDCSRAGIHKPTVAGIHGNSKEGCYSICVSGGYPEDVDTGNHIKFTGSGGRSLKGTKDQPKNLRTAPQDHDMELNNSNASLISSYNNQKAIRVVRGPKSHFHHSPINCYRYDGMYRCTAYSYEKGSSGFSVYLFTLERLPNQPELASLPRSLDDPLFQPIHKQISNYRQRNPVEINNSSISSPGSSSDVIVASSSQSHQSPISSGHTFCTEDNYSSSSTLSSLTSCFDSTESFSSPNLSRVSKVSTRSTTSKASESSIASNCVYPDSSPFKVPKQKTNSTSNIASASLSSRSSNSDKSNFPRTLMGCRIFSPFEPSSSAVENESSSPHDPLSTSSSLSKYFQEPSFSTISPNTEAALNEIFQFPSTTSDTSLSV